MKVSPTVTLRISDEVWIAAALLHKAHPEREDFSIAEIVERVRQERLAGELRPGVYPHVALHCVANKPPNPGRYRMLVATGRSRRRLYRPGDPYHQAREGAKHVPAREEVPSEYGELLDWYEREYVPRGRIRPEDDPLLALRGSGKRLWADEHADDYIRRLREGWE